MGYFSNGTAGDTYQAQWCERCQNLGADERSKETDTNGCPVLDAHLMANYEQCGDSKEAVALAAALSSLIPRDTKGNNGQCSMFRARRVTRNSEPVLPLQRTSP